MNMFVKTLKTRFFQVEITLKISVGNINKLDERFDRCLVNRILQHWKRLFFININSFSHLKLEIALAIPASNEWKIEVRQFSRIRINPLNAKLFNLNFHPLEVVSHWRDPHLQVSENYSDFTKWRSKYLKSCWLMSLFIFNRFKSWYVMC